MKLASCLVATLIFFTACTSTHTVDLLIHNAKIYTADSSFSTTEAVAIKEGKIIATGSSKDLLAKYKSKETVDAGGLFVYPGFIDAHAHFYRYGLGLQTADLTGTSSWQAIIDTLQSFATTHTDGWLIGRGWDQNDWAIKEFPSNELLNKLFPNRPVLLTRVDGHAAIANNKALALAGIKPGDKMVGGTFETSNNQLTGLLVDNAVDKVAAQIPLPTAAQMKTALLDAQANCFAMGLTTVDDCGLDFNEVLFIDSLQKTGALKMRLFGMLSDSKKNYDFALRNGKIKTPFLNVSSFKVYADGALGSRGASLLQDYTDKPGWKGFLLSNPQHFDSVAAWLYKNNFQMCTHAIGDSGNRTILNIYAKYLQTKNNRRWRIEHAQVVNENDFALFGQYSIIPSVQPTHATSDMYWAAQRLGTNREKGAYAFNDLLQQNGWIPLGTDFPVEDISPFKTFYAAVFRIDAKGYPNGGYQPKNALSRQQALKGMTIWAAKSNFEETEKGSIEAGKWADLILLDTDLMTAPPAQVLKAQVQKTWVGGQQVYSKF
ncbi:MAG: amidohydrolase family protein [Flavihumibacter sp.]|nr:amidohydrolase family protein [Flavihumibacter sp.]